MSKIYNLFAGWMFDTIVQIRRQFRIIQDEMGLGKSKIVKYKNAEGQLHRIDGPAFEEANGSKEW